MVAYNLKKSVFQKKRDVAQQTKGVLSGNLVASVLSLNLNQNTGMEDRYSSSSSTQSFRCEGSYGHPSEILSICSLGVPQVGSRMLQLFLLWYS